MPNFYLPSNPTNFITATLRPLRHLQSRHTSLVQAQPVSSAPSSTKKQATQSNIANSSRSPNIGTFGLVALPMNLGGCSKVFASTRSPTSVSSSRNQMAQREASIDMAVLFATTVLGKMNHTGLGSLWVVIALTTLGTKACQQPISPSQNSFSTLLFLLPAHFSMALTLPTSI